MIIDDLIKEMKNNGKKIGIIKPIEKPLYKCLRKGIMKGQIYK